MMKKILAIISVLVLLTPAIVIAGFDADGWNLKANMFKGTGDKWPHGLSAEHQVTAKWSDNFDLAKLCDGIQLDDQEEGAWLTITYKKPDKTMSKSRVECGSDVVGPSTLYGCNCFIVWEK